MIAIAVDDEPIALDVVKAHAARVPFIELVATFTNAFDAINYLQKNVVDLIFLDIKMPDISGIDFVNTLANPPMVVFTTAYSEHAVKGFELNAVDYLLKPFSLSRFLKSCNKTHELYLLRGKTEQMTDTSTVFIKDGYEQIKVELGEILFVEAAGNYTKIYLKSEKLLSTRVTVNDMQLLLPGKIFIRIHRAFIVAKNKVDRFDRTQVIIGEHNIPVGATYAHSLQLLA
jgi:two-component system LytT family response regulator